MAVNGSVLNGELLGAGGGVDLRVYLYIDQTFGVTSACALTPARGLTCDQTVSGTGVVGGGYMTGHIFMSSGTTVTATGVVATTNYLAKYLSASITASVTSVAETTALRYLASAVTSLVSYVTGLIKARPMEAAQSVTVTSAVNVSGFIGYAPVSRAMTISAENRVMEA